MTDTAAPMTERQRQRARIKERLAEREIALHRVSEIKRLIKGVEEKLDSLAAEHESDMQPLQAELREIEGRVLESLKRGQPIDPDDELARRGLYDRIRDATAKFESQVAGEKGLLKRLSRDKAAAEKEIDHKAQPSLLTNPEVADPALLADLHVAKQGVKWAHTRQRAALDMLGEVRNHIADLKSKGEWRGDTSLLELQLLRWEREASAAQEAVAEATAALSDAHQRVIDE